ncbi:T9SS type A sorting domain-containing protein, partial [Calditrichota bacterium]
DLSLTFADTGNFAVQVTIVDSTDVDSVIWQVRVDPFNSVVGPAQALPTELMLYPATPNPFNAFTTISYSLPTSGSVSLTIFDVQGRELQRIAGGFMRAGSYSVVWDASGLPSGMYYGRLETSEEVRTLPLLLEK